MSDVATTLSDQITTWAPTVILCVIVGGIGIGGLVLLKEGIKAIKGITA